VERRGPVRFAFAAGVAVIDAAGHCTGAAMLSDNSVVYSTKQAAGVVDGDVAAN